MRGKEIVLAAALLLFASRVHTQTAAGSVKTAGESMKNVRVLTDVRASQWNDTMWFMSTSLGVSCEHCHTGQAYEKDDRKAKQTARYMIQMTREINARHFDGRLVVTCHTCHQGSLMPKGSPALWNKTPEEAAALRKERQEKAARAGNAGAAPAAAPEAAQLPEAEQVLANYRRAVGAVEVKTIHLKASVTFDTRDPVDVEMDMAMPDRMLQQATVGGAQIRQVLNGDQGWTIAPGRTIEMTPANIEGARKGMALFGAVKLTPAEAPRKTTSLEKIDGRTFTVVESRSATHLERLYFDVQTGLLHRLYGETHTPLGDTSNETILADYRDVGGVKIPFQIVARSPMDSARYTVSEIEVNQPIDPARFERPQVAAAAK